MKTNLLILTRRSVALTILAVACSIPARTQPDIGDFGFGLTLIEPTGITVKGSAGSNNSWDAALGSSWFGGIRIHADYMWNVDAFNSREVGLYIGLGGVVGFGKSGGVVFKERRDRWYFRDDDDAAAFGVRAVAGVNAMPFSAPVELFFEVAPVVGITPATGLGTDVAVGIRYYP